MARLQSGAVQFSWQLESAADEAASATVQQMIITDRKQSRTDAVGQGRTPVLVDMNADYRSILVNAPVAEVYRRCLEFAKLPEFISSIRKIEKTSPTSFSCLWAKSTASSQLTSKLSCVCLNGGSPGKSCPNGARDEHARRRSRYFIRRLLC